MPVSLERLLETPASTTPFFCYPILPRRGRLVIGAPPKSYKSFLALNIAYELAEGIPLFGIWQVTVPLTVLVVEQEIGPWRLKERMATIHAARNGAIAPYNLYVTSKDLRIKIDNPPGLAALAQEIEACKPSVVILDPLRKLHRRDEDESTAMVEIFANLDWLQDKYDLSTIIVHHCGKRSEFRDMANPEALRGSSEIFADVDSVIMIEQPVRNVKEKLRLNFTFRSAQEPPPLLIQFDKDTMTFQKWASEGKCS